MGVVAKHGLMGLADFCRITTFSINNNNNNNNSCSSSSSGQNKCFLV